MSHYLSIFQGLKRSDSEIQDDLEQLAETGRLSGIRLKNSTTPNKWDYIVLSNDIGQKKKSNFGKPNDYDENLQGAKRR